MKILHAIGKLEGGGAETQLNILLKNLQYKDVENVVVSYQENNTSSETYYYISKTNNLIKNWRFVYSILKKEKPDILHIWIPAVFHVFLLPGLFYSKTKILLGARSVYKLDNPKRYIHLAFFSMARNIVSNTSLQDQKGLFKIVFSHKRYKHIPNAIKYIYEERFSINSRKSIQLLFVGRLIKSKNVSLLIVALSQLKDRYNFELNICGKGPVYSELLNLTKKLNLTERVFFKGEVNDLKPFYRNSHILVLPTKREGMPNVVFEALCFNNIVVLSDLTELKRWFKNNDAAIFFRNNDLKSLKNSLVRAFELKPDEIKHMNKINRDLVLSLSQEKYLNHYYNYYKDLLDGK